jgi:hypothetical protein
MTGSLNPNVSKQTEAEELLIWQILPLTFMQCQGYECVEQYLPLSTGLLRMVLNEPWGQLYL